MWRRVKCNKKKKYAKKKGIKRKKEKKFECIEKWNNKTGKKIKGVKVEKTRKRD